MPTEQQALVALDEIERVIRSHAGIDTMVCGGAVSHDPMMGEGMCAEYGQIRPKLDTALPTIDRIPLYGVKIAAAIRFLMQIADTHCRRPSSDA